ncbi:MAG: DNA polymerase III subunit alpha [Prevotellaceae bacterium]|jgi:DNA polymerase-3 subunit alpha|nr:DNA polymerase III subunit alpha [Prevotellaceae bacterium]
MFAHLHVHTEYSILDGAAKIDKLFAKAQADGQPALAITDHGNMFGVQEFLKKATEHQDVKPIVGCEVYVSPDGRDVRRGKEDQSSNHLILLAKSLEGYHNLIKLTSKAYTEGFYYKPRIDHKLLEKYNKGLIACSACLAGEVPSLLLKGKKEEAEARMVWYKQLFKEDYYIELQRHKSNDPSLLNVYNDQRRIAPDLISLATKHDIKLIATNDVHFVDAGDALAHDRLICINTNSPVDDPDRMRYTREEYLKTKEEMAELFADLPGVVENSLEIVEKIERYTINSDPIMPNFPIPETFLDADAYLRHLTYEGAEKCYGDVSQAVTERIEFELQTVKKMGFPGYFLIVSDFIRAAREMGVWVGPGRGSAAGSVVAYCLGITKIDPLKYGLLFERFLNPDRISMPDMDIDFSDDGRAKVLQYVEDKYGKEHVSHVVTFNTLGAKGAIRDVARIQGLPLSESDRLAKMVPDRMTDKLGNVVPASLEYCYQSILGFKEELKSNNPLIVSTLEYAQKLEGTVRNTGVHACAIIIGKNDLMEHIPVCTVKDKETGAEVLVSQYEGSCIEEVGMLKMDFLGLRTLSILREAVDNVKRVREVEVNLDALALDDNKTFELFSRGDTVGVFQFESDGMRKWLSELKPSHFEDLIAMNALYRPGPMDKIPDFIDRKFKRKVIEYDLPDMEEDLAETYGITVYQEQVMLLSQKLAGFTRGEADALRKAMGKKDSVKMREKEKLFKEGGLLKGHPQEKLKKIWEDWVFFAEYAFNKSHATCYALLGYQTAWLKTNHPAEFMAAVFSRNLDNMDEISKYMDECRRMGITVLGPDINESEMNFTVNANGAIRFGLGGIKGVGSVAVELVVQERKANGNYVSVYDFVERVHQSALNKKTMEGLVYGGAFDSFLSIKRADFFGINEKAETFLDQLIRYGIMMQLDRDKKTNSLFDMHKSVPAVRPEPKPVQDYLEIELLNKERELVGIYLSAHPLDNYAFEIKHFVSHSLPDAAELLKELSGSNQASAKEIAIAGQVTMVKKSISKKSNQPWASFTVEDFKGTLSFSLFGRDYERYMGYLETGKALFIRCLLQPRLGSRTDEWEFRISAISLLANLKDDLIKHVSLKLPIEIITQQFRKEFVQILKEHSGKTRLELKIVDKGNQIAVDFFSRSFRVSMNRGFLDFLEQNRVEYQI